LNDWIAPIEVHSQHVEELRRAKLLLERPSLAVKLTDALGAPIERGFKLLPEKWSETINSAVRISLERALTVAVRSLRPGRTGAARDRFHRWAVAATGAGGGAFGLAGLVVELPVSTTIMLRSIADIARAQGEDVDRVESQLACLEVFALGGRTPEDDSAETGYFAVRSALAGTVSEAARYLTERGLTEKGAPALVRLMTAIGGRFGVAVSEKIAATAIPVLGAFGGAAVNTLFINHFQDMAKGHFTVRRLERVYGRSVIQNLYNQLEG
jgi:hypothetical protein